MPDTDKPDTTALKGGALVVKRLLETRLYRRLTSEQAHVLWSQCATRLRAKGLDETIAEAQSSEKGSLDTLPRGDVLDVLAEELTGLSWPLNMTPRAVSDAFWRQLDAELDRRQYAAEAAG
jgi:uncharacterized circularly permuted ATP-grasp superfamily protein